MDEEQYGQFINRSELKTERMRNALIEARQHILDGLTYSLNVSKARNAEREKETQRILDLIREVL